MATQKAKPKTKAKAQRTAKNKRPAGGQKRTEAQRERDLVLVSEWYCRGYTLRKMAEMLKELRGYSLSWKMIHKDVQKILERWREAAIDNVEDLQASELARIAEIEREAWEQWEASKAIREKTETERRIGSTEVSRAKKVTEQGLGDPRYLQVVQHCIKQRVEILGLNAPQKHEHEIFSWADLLAEVSQ